MDVYGRGQEIGALIVCYCKKKNINIDEFMKEIHKEKSIFISGISDGVGGNRTNGRCVNNYILENMKIK